LPNIRTAPDSIVRAIGFDGCEEHVLILRMNYHCVAVVAALSPELARVHSGCGVKVGQIQAERSFRGLRGARAEESAMKCTPSAEYRPSVP
jgi:hypothetical protein